MSKLYNACSTTLQNKSLWTSLKVKKEVSLLLFLVMMLFAKITSAQTYVNGSLSTGATSLSGVAAPTGFTWSEVQPGNGTTGFAGSATTGLWLMDDFTVPVGSTWQISQFTVYGYQTNYAGATSPFTTVRYRIRMGSFDGPVIYGDATTNRFANSVSAGMYRIGNTIGTPAAPANTARHIWEVNANADIALPPGTYWIEWQTDVTGGGAHFVPTSTIVGQTTQPGYNARQFNGTGSSQLLDGTNAVDLPFKVTYTTPPCAGTPNPGNTLSTITPVCSGRNFMVYTENLAAGVGIAYQWQSAPDVAGPWTDITGANLAYYFATLTANTAYRVRVTCGANTANSTPLLVNLGAANTCYCVPPSSNCGAGDVITRVVISTLNNQSNCGTQGYTDYTLNSAINVPVLATTGVYPLAVTAGNVTTPALVQSIAAWIDYNANGVFEASEYINLGTTTTAATTRTVNVTIPATVTTGITRMRIRAIKGTTALTAADACLGITNGETEDYFVNLINCVAGTIVAQPVNATIGCSGTATMSVQADGTLLTYQWEVRTSAAAPWTTVTNNANYSGATTNALTISGTTPAFNGYQYRVQITGTCTPAFASNPATLTVGPLTATITPASPGICSAGGVPALIRITDINPLPVTSTFNSGTIAVPVPDNSTAGVTSTLPVTLPPNVTVTGLSVRLNMTHTWVGDMVFVLKAPNGQTLNLIYYLSGTGGAAATTGLTNTVISSTGTAFIATGTNPFTGTFRADALLTGSAANPSGPDGYLPTTTTWNDLYSNPNGTWTLAMYDGFDPDPGTLTGWSLDFTYSQPLQGVFSPTAGLFTDAAGTIPYTGTPIDSLYAFPATSTTYQVTVANALCTSAPISVPVTITNAITGLTVPAPAAICSGGNTTLSANTTAGNNISYQWQIAPNTPITNGGIYSGATTNTLTITGATTSANYNVVATNACGSVTSGNVSLTVNTAVTPTFNTIPALCTGSTAPVLPTTSLNGISGTWSPATVNTTTAGTYTHTFTPGASQCASPVTITIDVNNPAVITTQPAIATTGCIGGTATFTVAGTGITGYQWQVSTDGGTTFNQVSNGNAASYTTPVLTAAQNGYVYNVILNGACGTITSGNSILTVTTGPAISTQPATQTVCEGSAVTFAPVVTGASLTYQWEVSTNGGGTWTALTGETNASLLLSNVTTAQSGNQYRLVVTSACGNVNSNAATLTVNPGASITTQPTAQLSCNLAPVTFTVAASGAGLTYQWQVSTDGGTTFTDVPGAGSASFTFTPTAVQDGNVYHAVITASCGSLISANADLVVTASPVIITQPASTTDCTGNTVTLTSAANGSGLTYQWEISTNGGTTWTAVGGANSATLSVGPLTSAMNNDQYHVIVTNGCGNVTSNAATITVNDAVSISAQPQAQTACLGADATFSVTATGTGLTYQWQLSTDGGATFNPVAGATNASYTVTGVTSAQNGHIYNVILSGTCGNVTSDNAVLTASTGPAITTQPTAVTGCAGTSATFNVVATGATSYQWQSSSDNGTTWTNVAGGTNASLVINPVTSAMNNNQYRVIVTNACGSTNSDAAALTVNDPVVITTQPVDQSGCIGGSVTYTVNATGTGVTYQWQGSTDGGATWTNIPTATASSLTIPALTTSMNGLIRVVVSGTCSAGGVQSSSVGLSVLGIITEPAATVAACVGGDAALSVVASGSGLSYQWQVSTDGGTTFTDIPNETNSTLNLVNLNSAADGNEYQVVISSSCSVTSSSSVLTVSAAPTVSLAYATGSSTLLEATASPVGSYSYEWTLNGTPVTGTANTLDVSVNGSGEYTVTVTNTATGCSATSNAITVVARSGSGLAIYPNPNNGNFKVSFNDGSTGSVVRTLQIYDAKGARVMSQTYRLITAGSVINVWQSNLAGGTYSVIMKNESGKVIASGTMLVR